MRILVPLPHYGFDPTESSIPWKILTDQGHTFLFCTPDARPAAADERMISGKNLGIWGPLLRARADAVEAYKEMCQSKAFQTPSAYHQIVPDDAEALLLPGGHDKGMCEYIDSLHIQELGKHYLSNNKPVAAICHGVVVLARAFDQHSGRSPLAEFNTTALLKSQEMTAYHLTRWWLGDYYRTYPRTTVEDEVKSALLHPNQFMSGPLPLTRDTLQNPSGFTVRDRNYLSARWPGDAYSFAIAFGKMLR